MDTATLIKLRQRTNIPVTEEAKHTDFLGALQSKAKLWSNLILPDVVPILKALVIVTLWLTSGLGYTPVGCKTQYLFSDQYWYNKQLVIFFIIYFIVNVGGEAVTKLKSPLQEFTLSVITWLLFNIMGRLGKIWLDKSPWFWPSPLTWFGAVALPLVTMYILDDIRKYFISEHALKDSESKISLIECYYQIKGTGTLTISATSEEKDLTFTGRGKYGLRPDQLKFGDDKQILLTTDSNIESYLLITEFRRNN